MFGLFKLFSSKKKDGNTSTPKPKYKHYGQRKNPDSKRSQRFGPKKD